MAWTIKILFLCLMVSLCLGCTCYTPHIQDAFCESEVVIRGKALPVPETATHTMFDENAPILSTPPYELKMHRFDVEVIEVFKAPANSDIKSGDVIQAVTTGSGAMCGGYLSPEVHMLITGSHSAPRELSFYLCSYKMPYELLTNFQIEGIRGSYSCECLVDDWRNNKGCYTSSMIDRVYGNKNYCLEKHARCVKKDDDCKWEIDKTADCVIQQPTTMTLDLFQ